MYSSPQKLLPNGQPSRGGRPTDILYNFRVPFGFNSALDASDPPSLFACPQSMRRCGALVLAKTGPITVKYDASLISRIHRTLHYGTLDSFPFPADDDQPLLSRLDQKVLAMKRAIRDGDAADLGTVRDVLDEIKVLVNSFTASRWVQPDRRPGTWGDQIVIQHHLYVMADAGPAAIIPWGNRGRDTAWQRLAATLGLGQFEVYLNGTTLQTRPYKLNAEIHDVLAQILSFMHVREVTYLILTTYDNSLVLELSGKQLLVSPLIRAGATRPEVLTNGNLLTIMAGLALTPPRREEWVLTKLMTLLAPPKSPHLPTPAPTDPVEVDAVPMDENEDPASVTRQPMTAVTIDNDTPRPEENRDVGGGPMPPDSNGDGVRGVIPNAVTPAAQITPPTVTVGLNAQFITPDDQISMGQLVCPPAPERRRPWHQGNNGRIPAEAISPTPQIGLTAPFPSTSPSELSVATGGSTAGTPHASLSPQLQTEPPPTYTASAPEYWEQHVSFYHTPPSLNMPRVTQGPTAGGAEFAARLNGTNASTSMQGGLPFPPAFASRSTEEYQPLTVSVRRSATGPYWVPDPLPRSQRGAQPGPSGRREPPV